MTAAPQAPRANWDNNPPPRPARSFDPNGYGAPSSGGSRGGYGEGKWVDGKHMPGAPNQRLERELFGVPNRWR